MWYYPTNMLVILVSEICLFNVCQVSKLIYYIESILEYSELFKKGCQWFSYNYFSLISLLRNLCALRENILLMESFSILISLFTDEGLIFSCSIFVLRIVINRNHCLFSQIKGALLVIALDTLWILIVLVLGETYTIIWIQI